MKDPITFVEGGVEEPNKELKEFIDKNIVQIESSGIFVSLFTTSFEKSPMCMLQLALAMFLDKPIYLIVEEGVMPSSKLLKIIDGWEFFKKDKKESVQVAMKVILDLAKMNGHFKEDK